MRILQSEIDRVTPVPPPGSPNYDVANPIMSLLSELEAFPFAADRQHYLADSLQFLFPISSLAFWGPSGEAWQEKDPRAQDNKNDFQKQNLREFSLTGVEIARGFAAVEDWTGSFLSIAYTPQPNSPLLAGRPIYRENTVRLYLKVGHSAVQTPLDIPFDQASQKFRIELWALERPDLIDKLGPKAKAAYGKHLLARPDLVKGTMDELAGLDFEAVRRAADANEAGVEMIDYAADHSMHPIRPLKLELAWGSANGEAWDSDGGRNHRLEFSMSFRGWGSYLAVGSSRNAHGGLGSLEYRNLYSNYFGHEAKRRAAYGQETLSELGRDLPEWSFDANGSKPPKSPREPFMAVDYMDLHILQPNSIIGIHRHRDNQEAFMVLDGKALMVMADWVQRDDRARAFEIRTMRPGDISLVKGGQMHALVNCLDEKVILFMFGGYD